MSFASYVQTRSSGHSGTPHQKCTNVQDTCKNFPNHVLSQGNADGNARLFIHEHGK